MDKEEWRTVIYNGEEWSDYEVSSHGRVRSLNYNRTGKIKILKQTEDKSGYLYINLCKNGKRKAYLVHRLVAIAFIPNPQNKPTVNHIDENKTNNHVENLEWATMKEQCIHGTRTERSLKTRSLKTRTRSSKRVLCVETGIVYDSIKQASGETGLAQSNIWCCCNGKRKTCGKLHWEYYTEETE